MTSRRLLIVAVVLVLSVPYLVSQNAKEKIDSGAMMLFRPLPSSMDSAHNPVTEAKIALGRTLYYEPRLSANQKISCNTCHPLDSYGAENDRVSTGHKQQKGGRNAPTVYMAAGHFAQFWDGRAP